MKLLIKQRVFSWTDSYDVYDENSNPKYYIKAEFFSLGHVLHVYRCDTGEEIGVIRQKVLTLFAQFDIEVRERTIGTIRKQLSFFIPKYEVNCNNWKVEGDFLGWNYIVHNGERRILDITKEIFHWGDTYVLDIYEEQDEQMGLMLVLAIDAANCSG